MTTMTNNKDNNDNDKQQAFEGATSAFMTKNKTWRISEMLQVWSRAKTSTKQVALVLIAVVCCCGRRCCYYSFCSCSCRFSNKLSDTAKIAGSDCFNSRLILKRQTTTTTYERTNIEQKKNKQTCIERTNKQTNLDQRKR